MKHNKVIAALVATGSLFAMSGAHAIAPAIAAAVAGISGVAIGSATTQAANAPTAVVVPTSPTVVLGGPPAPVQEVIPAPREGYAWQAGHFEMNNNVSVWVPGHWVPKGVTVYQQN